MPPVSFHPSCPLRAVATYLLPRNVALVVAQGSVVDFEPPRGFPATGAGAIVNAANEGCLGGGGVDGAISSAGGRNLADDRKALPVLVDDDEEGILFSVRCPTGQAKLTGPNDYDRLKVPYVIHAVGPKYFEYQNFGRPNRLLYMAYQSAMECCRNTDPPIEHVGFSLLSAGIFRGSQTLLNVLQLGVRGIREYLEEEEKIIRHGEAKGDDFRLRSVTLCAFTPKEIRVLLKACVAEGLVAVEKDEDDGDVVPDTATTDTSGAVANHCMDVESQDDYHVAFVSQDSASGISNFEAVLKEEAEKETDEPAESADVDSTKEKVSPDATDTAATEEKGKDGTGGNMSPAKKPKLK